MVIRESWSRVAHASEFISRDNKRKQAGGAKPATARHNHSPSRRCLGQSTRRDSLRRRPFSSSSPSSSHPPPLRARVLPRSFEGSLPHPGHTVPTISRPFAGPCPNQLICIKSSSRQPFALTSTTTTSLPHAHHRRHALLVNSSTRAPRACSGRGTGAAVREGQGVPQQGQRRRYISRPRRAIAARC